MSYCDLPVEKIIQEPPQGPKIELFHFIIVYIVAMCLLDIFSK